jgi:peptide/nickel transport system permease protein
MTQAATMPIAPRRAFVRELFRHPGVIVGSILLGVLIVSVVAAPLLTSGDPLDQSPSNAFQPPSAEYPMGTDNFGRDVFTRFLYGGRVSLQVGLVATAIGASVGTLLGLLAGYYGGVFDAVISWLIDVLLAFPGILLALVVIAILGTGLFNLMVAVGIAFIPSFTRLARAEVLQVREQDYIEAARALGSPDSRIIARHVLHNIVRPLLVLATLGMGNAILEGAALSFIGLGTQPPHPEWGAMLSAGRTFMRQAWWITVFPGLGIFLTILAVNLLGDGLGDMIGSEYQSQSKAEG